MPLFPFFSPSTRLMLCSDSNYCRSLKHRQTPGAGPGRLPRLCFGVVHPGRARAALGAPWAVRLGREPGLCLVRPRSRAWAAWTAPGASPMRGPKYLFIFNYYFKKKTISFLFIYLLFIYLFIYFSVGYIYLLIYLFSLWNILYYYYYYFAYLVNYLIIYFWAKF
jgi:hypothetical protein